MAIGRWFCLMCLGLAPPASGLPLAQTQTAQRDIIVNGATTRKLSAWKRAETAHVVVLSKGSDAELVRIAKNLERLHHLMSRLYRRGDPSDDAVKLRVTLLDSAADFRALRLPDLRAQEGPYQASFAGQSYYDPREDGPVLAIARSDQMIDLNTNRAYNLDCDDALANGATECNKNVPYRWPVARTWEQSLYAAFARHFILTYQPAVYPRWYLDGVGALFSTFRVRGNGAIDYAREPEQYRQVFRSYGDLNAADILAGRYLDAPPKDLDWTPYHAWLLAHFFLYSNLKPERSREFQHYMTAIHQGQSMADAAKAFGNPGALQREIARYVTDTKSFARTGRAEATVEEPIVTTLSASNGALVEARIELGAHLASLATTPSEAERDRAWLAQLRADIAKLPYDSDAMLFAAEAECRGGLAAECLADADRVLAQSPDNVGALTWKGVALTDRAIALPPAERAGALTVARQTIARAIGLDGDAPQPRIAYFESFAKAGERVPDDAMLGMAKVIRDVPAAPAPRLYLAAELLRQGKPDLARRIASLLLLGPYDSPEKTAAKALFARAA